MKNTKTILLTTLLISALLTGCQQVNQQRSRYVRDREKDYLSSTVNAPLRVPGDLSYFKGNEHYAYPDVMPGQIQPVSIVPPGFGEISQS